MARATQQPAEPGEVSFWKLVVLSVLALGAGAFGHLVRCSSCGRGVPDHAIMRPCIYRAGSPQHACSPHVSCVAALHATSCMHACAPVHCLHAGSRAGFLAFNFQHIIQVSHIHLSLAHSHRTTAFCAFAGCRLTEDMQGGRRSTARALQHRLGFWPLTNPCMVGTQ